MEVVEFLTLVWGDRGGWVDLPSKIKGHWIPWIASWPDDKPMIRRRVEDIMTEENLYFSVAQFNREGRMIDATMSSHWLWADLDRVSPLDCAALDLTPTVCWESSPWRFQALWRLDAKLKPKPLARLNKALTYAIGADKGGWDLTQVLRPVGSRNWKHPGAPEVMLVYDDGPEYEWRELWARLKDHLPDQAKRKATERWRIDAKDRIPARARQLLTTPLERMVEGERSEVLWRLNCTLAEAGFEEDQIFTLVEPCVWNKWPNSPDRLKRDISRAVSYVIEKTGSNGHKPEAAKVIVPGVVTVEELAEEEEELKLPFTPYGQFMSKNLEAPSWLIDGLWMSQSHGIISGEAKSSKSLIAMAMGLAVASGRDFLGLPQFKVRQEGAVLLVQEENSPWDVQDKLMKLAAASGLIKEGHFPHDFPLMLLNNYGFDMSNLDHQAAIERHIEKEGAVLLILDPLYLMLGAVDADKSWNVVEFQKWLLHVRHTHGCAIMLVHHFGKPRVENKGIRAGHRMLGSGTWYNWVESALYCQGKEPDEWMDDSIRATMNRRVVIDREWRTVAPRAPLDLRMHMGKRGSMKLIVESTLAGIPKIVDEMTTIVNERPGISVANLAEELGLKSRMAKKLAVESGKFRVKQGARWGRGYQYHIYVA